MSKGVLSFKAHSTCAMKLLLMAVMLAFINTSYGQSCDVAEDFQNYCRCDEDHPGTFKITCSCEAQQTLKISDSFTSSLPPTVTAFHIHNCNSSVTIESDAFYFLNTLENVTFESIASLKLESNSLRVFTQGQEDFFLTFDTILHLSLEEDAVQIQGQGGHFMTESLVIRNCFIVNLPSRAISGTFSELTLEKVILAGQAGSKAIDVGDVGADVTIALLDALTQGLGSEWLTGEVKTLVVTNNTLDMQPRAFAGIRMRGTPPLSITMSHNKFGFPKYILGSDKVHSESSLPSGVFDLDVSAEDVSITSENNQITCECRDLPWLLKKTKNNLQQYFKFTCMKGNLDSALKQCNVFNASPGAKPAFAIILSFVLMAIL